MIPETMLTLGGKAYTLRWDLKCTSEYEALYKKSDFIVDTTVDTQIKRLWIMLKKTEPELTLEQVEELVQAEEGGYLNPAIAALKTHDNACYGYIPKNSKAPTKGK